MIAQAQSGTGKTATFSISILQSIDTTVRETQVRRLWVSYRILFPCLKVEYRYLIEIWHLALDVIIFA